MAQAKTDKGIVPVYGGDDGYLAVQAAENKALDNYLSVYSARIDGYKLEPSEKCTWVTMKIAFPVTDNENNVNMWAWFISKAAHPTASKPKVTVRSSEHGLVAYVKWPIWSEVRYMESKHQGGSSFDF